MSVDPENNVTAAPVAEEETAPVAAEGSNRRCEVFIRGLNYSTRELALARYIETVAPVEEVHILTNFKGRSKGTAFVTLKDAKSVDDVVEKLNGKVLDGRYLEIQRAKPLSELPPKPRIIYRPYPAPYRRAPFGFRGGRGRYHPRNVAAAEFSHPHPAPETRPPRHQKGEPNPNRTLSEYTVAVLNLPFVAKEQDMSDIFDGFEILNPKICRNRAGMSKGTAFVTLASHEEQKRAIESVNLSQVEGRQIRVVEAYLLPEELEEEKRILKEHQK